MKSKIERRLLACKNGLLSISSGMWLLKASMKNNQPNFLFIICQTLVFKIKASKITTIQLTHLT